MENQQNVTINNYKICVDSLNNKIVIFRVETARIAGKKCFGTAKTFALQYLDLLDVTLDVFLGNVSTVKNKRRCLDGEKIQHTKNDTHNFETKQKIKN